MGGSMPFHDALAARLAVMRPSLPQLTRMLAERPPTLTDGVTELVAALHARGQHVWLVSGGFRQMIEPVAARLGIAEGRVVANTLRFDADGSFAGHDGAEPTARAGGKLRAIAALKASRGYGTVVMVGDGATDMEASHGP
jgi:phosphoserine phosphatase